jgi:hypothetical protein
MKKKIILTLAFEKNNFFFAENWQKLQKNNYHNIHTWLIKPIPGVEPHRDHGLLHQAGGHWRASCRPRPHEEGVVHQGDQAGQSPVSTLAPRAKFDPQGWSWLADMYLPDLLAKSILLEECFPLGVNEGVIFHPQGSEFSLRGKLVLYKLASVTSQSHNLALAL